MNEEDPLKKYNNTSTLYKKVKEYLTNGENGRPIVTKDTPFPIVCVCINKCIEELSNKRNKKPREKVEFLCYKFLDDINYRR